MDRILILCTGNSSRSQMAEGYFRHYSGDRERCPYFPSRAKKYHQNFPDPARATGTEEDILQQFREVRDMIREYVLSTIYTIYPYLRQSLQIPGKFQGGG